MAGQTPAGPLMREHRVIERMIAVLQAELESIAATGRTDPARIDSATDFIRTYADRCHHGKEEDILFRQLADKQLDEQLFGAMNDLIQDHVHARGLIGQLVQANARYADGDLEALGEIEWALQALVEFYPVHIEKEDQHFFKRSLEYFTDEERAQILRDFDEFDRALIHEKYRLLVEELERDRG